MYLMNWTSLAWSVHCDYRGPTEMDQKVTMDRILPVKTPQLVAWHLSKENSCPRTQASINQIGGWCVIGQLDPALMTCTCNVMIRKKMQSRASTRRVSQRVGGKEAILIGQRGRHARRDEMNGATDWILLAPLVLDRTVSPLQRSGLCAQLLGDV